MTPDVLIPLARTTLREPRRAAETILSWQLSRETLWTAMALVAALYTFVLSLLIALTPSTLNLPGYAASPLALFVLVAGIMVVYVHAAYWTGLATGGSGTLDGLLAVMVWLQVMRAVAELALIVLSFVMPAMATLASIVLTGWSLWVMLHFLVAALHLPSMGKAFLVLVLSGIGLVVGLGILLALIGLTAQGVLN
ncbi:YIP1 family protein [Sulfitobacter mediterraneus]|jgi:hypothetical protein|uniref:Yip1-like protein n=1 Tax=Sulfitobacter mediterraneus TaxID=83219 RepID=A0A2T6CD37_9RHOB|nr:Yip1 family protein [Sulfitobacter mediterraneus]KIN79587.1 hypothetical protein Z950_120 [Sulfitobacter mediterraneus KCTC 32188]MBM1556528.1 YIP1 family protein [Sulfitobacter mediterraneus]MBM1569634.1 YIP1 family protein [Sulfitobacter mediterraneus]MBM1573591.1 YIP1 family protein [Sulfitobacter mediterraneus]MBM1577380.1 YIP1 family protein [Sulfitobacter mediterraneus]